LTPNPAKQRLKTTITKKAEMLHALILTFILPFSIEMHNTHPNVKRIERNVPTPTKTSLVSVFEFAIWYAK
jgi:hypothetical protein